MATRLGLKFRGAYRNTQCGLCGHYDDATNDENEMIMANNEFSEKGGNFREIFFWKFWNF